MTMAALTMKTDDGGFRFFLENVKGSKLKSALKSGLRKSLNIIKKQAVQNLANTEFKSGKVNVNKQVRFKNSQGTVYMLPSFKSGVMVKVKKDGSGGRAEIIGKGKNANLILPMIEAGKGERHTKGIKIVNHHKMRVQSRSTGSITHTFFTSAVNSTKGQVQSALQKGLEDAITKAKEKYYLK